MRKVLGIGVCLLVIVSFSFFKSAQQGGLKKIGKNLYELKSTTALSTTDQAKLRTIIAKQYGIKSFNQTITVNYVPEKGLKGNGVAMAEQKVSNADFSTTILEDGDEEVKQSCIYINCSNNPALGDVLRLLLNYNVQ